MKAVIGHSEKTAVRLDGALQSVADAAIKLPSTAPRAESPKRS
jgi:hypothetical protein